EPPAAPRDHSGGTRTRWSAIPAPRSPGVPQWTDRGRCCGKRSATPPARFGSAAAATPWCRTRFAPPPVPPAGRFLPAVAGRVGGVAAAATAPVAPPLRRGTGG